MRKTLIAAVLASAALAAAIPSTGATPVTSAAPQEKPNIVVVMTDDQDVASLRYMPRVRKLLMKRGMTFEEQTAVFPLCCPVRASYLSGQAGHNNKVRGNTAPSGGYDNLDATQTIPVWLDDAGYVSTHLGKYPNGYDGHQHPERNGVPPGWTEWHGAVDPTTYLFYDYVLNENGANVQHGSSEDDYQTDVLTDLGVDFIERSAESGAPFFLDVAYLAPHWEFRPGTSGSVDVGDLEGQMGLESAIGTPPIPAPRHLGMFEGEEAPRLPSFNEEDVSDKPQHVQDAEQLTKGQIKEIDQWYALRLASLQAVDEGVARLIRTLDRTGELDNTYFIYTADNGWLQGEHRLGLQKVQIYDESSNVPLIVRGPGVARGIKVEENTSSLDLTATIVDLAGAQPGEGHQLDGMSLSPYFSDPDTKLGRAVFVETGPGDDGYVAVRTSRWKYIEYINGDRELYDLRNDPFELESIHDDRSKKALKTRLSRLIERFRDCSGDDCVITER
jgi:arylsulfatase A-like enzyme